VRQDERERGTVEPLLHLRGRKGKLTGELKIRLSRFVTARPDATLNEIKEQLALDVSLSTVDRWLRKLGLSFKKSRSTRRNRTGPTSPPRGRSGVSG
jgi:transposase